MNTTDRPARSRSLWRRALSWNLNDPRLTAAARVWVPILFGLWSLFLGQDRNWDGFNYHQYNGFAFLNDKLHTDFAAAGMQTYFNPMLDVFYYALNRAFPAPLAGFIMGALHGLNFVLLLSIIRRTLPELAPEDANRTPLLLAAAGILTANFLSGLGNSMGDDTTTLFVLASLLLILHLWDRLTAWSAATAAALVGGGLIVGLGMGLKLTNAPFALALCAGLLLLPAGPFARVRAAFLFGVGALAGLLAASGYWMAVMWHTFGNPFFPQFSSIFPNPLTPPGGVADQSWLPKSALEYVLWPFIFALDSKRVGQARLHQIIWPIVYVLFWMLAATRFAELVRRRVPSRRLNLRAVYVITFVALGYFLWMIVFSIYRYVVPIETLTPLVAYLLLNRLLPYLTARRAAAWLLSVTTLAVVAGGVETWGHEHWARAGYRADVPALDSPQNTTAVIVGGNPPWGWIVQFFPASVAFTQIDGSFPFSPQFDQHIADIVRSRAGPTYAIIEGRYNWRVDNVAKMDQIADALGLTEGVKGCNAMQAALDRLHLHASLRWTPNATDKRVCRLDIRQDDVRDVAGENAQLIEQARPALERHGFAIDAGSCTTYRAYVGQGVFPYQWCRITHR
ncbi:hypothetical protein PQR57_07015 [Paraburkholderia dipogonis]|uniref:DUF2029 domain-containing protein n=1 Tax=Paraburkholderia dipogonis TaxID=1211383 RepID=A0ABW9AMG0_9BURK